MKINESVFFIYFKEIYLVLRDSVLKMFFRLTVRFGCINFRFEKGKISYFRWSVWVSVKQKKRRFFICASLHKKCITLNNFLKSCFWKCGAGVVKLYL